MVLGIGHLELQPLQQQATAQTEPCAVGTVTVVSTDFHFGGPHGVIADGHIELRRQDEVGTDNEVLAQSVLPVVEPDETGRKP